MKVIYPPEQIEPTGSFWTREANPPTIFLGGTIDMGHSRDWQTEFVDRFKDTDYVFYNPRRTDWDSSWSQTIDDKNFRGQVEWELSALEIATFRVFNLLSGSASPITLMEIGLFKMNPSFVCCPRDYIPFCETEDELAILLQQEIDRSK